MTILLVDDKKENLYLLEKLLQGNGYETLSTTNGAEALASALKNPPDMIVSDILMPVMDGFTLCREWKKDKILKKIPFVFYTATYTDPKDEEFALSLGADRFIIKPQGMNDFLQVIRETFDAYKAQEQRPAPMKISEEEVFLKEYNETLVRRLEEKMLRVEAAEKELREKNTVLEQDIEERKHAEEVLRESEERYRSLFENMVEGYAYCKMLFENGQPSDFVYLKTNYTFGKLTGLKNVEGKKVSEVIPGIQKSDPELLKTYGRVALTGKPERFEAYVESLKDWYSVSVYSPMKEYFVAVFDVITDRKRAEEALKKSEARFRSYFELPIVGIAITSPTGGWIEVNDHLCEMLGYSREELYQTTWTKLTHPDDLTIDLEHFNRVLTGEIDGYSIDKRFICKNGVSIWTSMSVRCVRFADRKVDYFVALLIDISDRKRAEDKIRESEEKYRSIYENSNVGILLTVPDGTILSANDFACNLFGMTEEELCQRGRDKIIDTTDPRLSRSLEERQRSGRAKTELTFIRKDGSKFEGEIASVVFVDNGGKEKTSIIIQDLTDRKRAEEALRESELKFRTVADFTYDWEYWENENHDIVYNSPSCERVTGYSRKDFIIDPSLLEKIVHPDDGNIVHTHHERVFLSEHKNDFDELEFRIIRKDSSVVYINHVCRPIFDESDKYHGRRISNRDITERKHAEKALKESEEWFRTLADTTSTAIFIYQNERFVYANKAIELISGYTKDEFLSMRFWDIVHPDHRELVRQRGLARQRGEQMLNRYEFKIICKDGTERWFDFTAGIIDWQGQAAAIGTAFDITERKKLETNLSSAAEMAKLGYWEYDVASKNFIFNDQYFRLIHGSSAKKQGGTLMSGEEFARRFVHPDDAHFVGEDLQNAIESTDPNYSIKRETRVFRENGDVANVSVEFKVLKDPSGRTYKIYGVNQDITERKRAEEELSKSEEKYRSIFENVQDVYYEALIDGTILEVSPSIEIASKGQYKRDDIIGKSMYDFYSDAGRRMTLLVLLHERSAVSDFEIAMRNRDGSLIPCSTSAKMCFDAEGRPQKIIGSMREITQRKQAEEALRETRDYLENLLSFANAPIIVWDPDLKITRFNMAIEKLTGYTIYDVIDKHLEMLFPTENRKSSLALVASTSEGDHLITVEIPILSKNGNIHTVLWSTANIYAADGQTLISTIAQGQDITEQKKLQQKLIQAQKMESIGTLAGGIAHDFNNILGIILGYSSIIERKTMSPEKLHESLGVINNAVGRGAALVRQILTFARKTDVVFEAMSVPDLICELLLMLRQTFPKVITFTEMIQTDIPYIVADRTQLHQVLLNLCVNARDAMPNGGTITIKAEKQTKSQVQKRIHAADQDSYICISVTDTGEGMNEATRRQIFDPFFTTKELGKGTGLGLAVVYGAVQAHHGFIDVESEVGHGTTFMLYFPIPPASEQASDISLAAESFTTGGTETILLVEDEETLIEMVRFLLESNGYKVFIAQDGKEAIKMYTEHKQEIEIVLTDMGLPGMTGMEVFKKLKEIDPHVHVIAASGFFDPDVKSKLEKGGAKGFIQKPYSPDEVLRILRKVIDAKSD